ncbi:SDR family NAD(P)-dependent oxidoreductase [Nocardia sp. NPDC057227]|uniref:SDR family NAD(P)-dependent oxidoreductase n=1 Tax=Nocardia sp. NPDC057227 TaxID=3346056 RepID=UPI003644195B
MSEKSVFITGAGGGLGGATAALFAQRGWRVFAADLRPPAPAPNVIPLELDVTDAAATAAVTERVERESPAGLGAVVTFAGTMFAAPLVEADEADMRRIIDVNVLGTYRVVKATFPLVRRGGGRVITISSETGRQKALMLNGPYALTKHAVEAYSDALRRELMFLGVPVSIVQPGPFRTDMVGGIRATFDRARERSGLFTELIAKVGALAEGEQRRAHDPAVLAEVVWRAATARRPRRRYSVRPDPRRVAMHHTPDAILDPLLTRLLGGRR